MQTNKQTLICLIGQLGNGGSEKQLYLFLKYLDKSRFHPIVIVSNATNNIWEKRLKEELDISVEYLQGTNPFLKLLSFRKILQNIKCLINETSGKDIGRTASVIVYSWSFYTNIYKMITPGHIPFIGSLRVQIEEEKKGLNPLHFRLCLTPESFVVNSHLLSQDLQQQGVAPKRIHVIHNIFEPEFSTKSEDILYSCKTEYRKKFNIPEDAHVILGVGRNSPGKDFPFFVNVVEQVIGDMTETTKIYGCIIGEGKKNVEDLIHAKQLDDKFILPGEIENAWKVFPMADVFFLSSKIEGMPNVLLEAIDAGCGIISTEVGGVIEIMGDKNELPYQKGFIINHGDIKSATKGIKKLISDKQLKTKISFFLKQRLNFFSPENIMKKYMAIII